MHGECTCMVSSGRGSGIYPHQHSTRAAYCQSGHLRVDCARRGAVRFEVVCRAGIKCSVHNIVVVVFTVSSCYLGEQSLGGGTCGMQVKKPGGRYLWRDATCCMGDRKRIGRGRGIRCRD